MVRRNPARPTADEEREWIRAAQRGDVGARNRLMLSLDRLVAGQAWRRRHRSPLPMGDLVQEGMLGLVRAIERHDPDQGHLAEYATPWVRGAMALAERREPIGPARLPDGLARRKDEARVRIARRDPACLSWVAAPQGAREDPRLESLERWLAALDERERAVVARYFGLDGDDPETYPQIGRRLGFSGEWARKIGHRALDRLRSMARESGAA